jgi:hypothetical protein
MENNFSVHLEMLKINRMQQFVSNVIDLFIDVCDLILSRISV